MEEVDVRSLLLMFRRRWLYILLTPIVLAGIAFYISFFVMTPKYEAKTSVLINQKVESTASAQYDAVMASRALVATYTDIIESPQIEQDVIKTLHLNMRTDQLSKMIRVSSPNNSLVINISVVSPNERTSAKIANTIAATFQNSATMLMSVKNVQIVSPAQVQDNPRPVKPDKVLDLTLALILGLVLGVLIAFVLEYLDTKLRSEDVVLRYTKLPVLGSIYEFK